MSEHHHYHSSGGGFLQGFLLGGLIGAGLVFFLGTKRGKEIADEIKEKGLSIVDDFDELLEELTEDTAVEHVPPQTASAQLDEPAKYSDVQTTNNYSTVNVEDTKVSNEPPIPPHIETLQTHGRRLFTGIPKRR